ncbi:uncharacterized protein N7498_003630 [Penicillium cinerascens]|uniref:Uncharacterized protein n=1 Tax=Penicillium cinerascens TaxID=70096 RepID=A0A9W9T7B3_9EURO|nr:uncharacterized protein N7498_003630 [Penicillium cinerascens]KAJ5211984.1 hypothetical protein N7498_003630 [Penicillium cinerascens]
MENQPMLDSEFYRHNNTSIRRKPLNEDNTRHPGSEEDNDSPAPDTPASAPSEDNQKTTTKDKRIKAILKSLWWFLNLPIVTNAIYALIIIQLTIFIVEERQRTRNACAESGYEALLEAIQILTNLTNARTESIAAMAKKLEGL